MNYKEIISEIKKTKIKDSYTFLKVQLLTNIADMLKRTNRENSIIDFVNNRKKSCSLDNVIYHFGKMYDELLWGFKEEYINIYKNLEEMQKNHLEINKRNFENREMSSVGIYHKMNSKFIPLLEEFIIYRDIEYCAKEKGTLLYNRELEDLKEIILDFYNEDSIRNFPLSHSTRYIANNYIDCNITIKELKKCSFYEIYNAIEEDNIELLRKEEIKEKMKKGKNRER